MPQVSSQSNSTEFLFNTHEPISPIVSIRCLGKQKLTPFIRCPLKMFHVKHFAVCETFSATVKQRIPLNLTRKSAQKARRPTFEIHHTCGLGDIILTNSFRSRETVRKRRRSQWVTQVDLLFCVHVAKQLSALTPKRARSFRMKREPSLLLLLTKC